MKKIVVKKPDFPQLLTGGKVTEAVVNMVNTLMA